VKISLKKDCIKFLESIPKEDAKRILDKIKLMGDKDGMILGIKRLKDKEQLYSLRIGKYRALFKKDNDNIFIFVMKIGHRKNVYGFLKNSP